MLSFPSLLFPDEQVNPISLSFVKGVSVNSSFMTHLTSLATWDERAREKNHPSATNLVCLAWSTETVYLLVSFGFFLFSPKHSNNASGPVRYTGGKIIASSISSSNSVLFMFYFFFQFDNNLNFILGSFFRSGPKW